MANTFIKVDEVNNDEYLTDREAVLVIREKFNFKGNILTCKNGYILYDGTSTRVEVDGELIDLDDLEACEV